MAKQKVETIDLTPRGLTVEGGAERVNAAMKAFNDSAAELANAAMQFYDDYQDELKLMAARSDNPDAENDLNWLEVLIERRRVAQDEFMRAVAGIPARV